MRPIIVHDSEENSEHILDLINENNAIGSVLYLYAPVEKVVDANTDSTSGTDSKDADADYGTQAPTAAPHAATTHYAVDYGNSDRDYGNSGSSYSGSSYSRKRRSAEGARTMADWNLEMNSIPLRKILCQVMQQSQQVIQNKCDRLAAIAAATTLS